MTKVRILNTAVDNVTMEEAVDAVRTIAVRNRSCGGSSYVVTPNLDHLVNLEDDPGFAEAYRGAELVLPDGVSILLIARYLGTPLKEKVSGSDLFPKVCAMAAEKGLSLFILGASPGVAERAAANLCAQNPGLRIAGTYSPPWGFEEDAGEIRRIVNLVIEADPDILIVALGDMKGEKFLCGHASEMNVPISLSLGAAVDFAAQEKKRAPAWVSKAGFEWLYRSIQEPRRIGARVIKDIRRLPGLIAKYKRGARPR